MQLQVAEIRRRPQFFLILAYLMVASRKNRRGGGATLLGKGMAEQNDISATLKFSGDPEFRTNLMREKLTRTFLEADIRVLEDHVDDGGLRFSNRDMVVRVRPEPASIVVSVAEAADRADDDRADPADREADERHRRVTCFHAVRTLQKLLAPRTIDWSDVRQDAIPSAGVRPKRPARASLTDEDRLQIMLGAAPLDDARFGAHPDVGRTHRRLDQSFEDAQADIADADHETLQDHPAHAEAQASNRASERFPELVPAESLLRQERGFIFPASALDLNGKLVKDETTNPTERAEAYDMTARLTVYVLNLAVLVAAFPVGFALLIFNILGGENLRTTAHVVALTGVGTVIAQTGAYQPLLAGLLS